MDNTVQMHKTVPSPRRWRAITIKHDHWRQRTYVPVAAGAWRAGVRIKLELTRARAYGTLMLGRMCCDVMSIVQHWRSQATPHRRAPLQVSESSQLHAQANAHR